MSKKLKICIISEYALPYLIGGSGTGGAELQMTLLAKGLLNRKYDVNIVVFDEEIGKYGCDGINVYVPYDNKKKGYTHFHPLNLYKIFKILKQIDADIYIQRAGSPLTGIITFFSKLSNKIFIFSVSSDVNVSLALQINDIKDCVRLPFIYGLKNCTQVVCQTFHQMNLLRKHTTRKSVVIRNIFNPFQNDTQKVCENGKRKKSVLWVGRLIIGKFPELYIQLARELPDYNFKMVGSPLKGDEEYYYKIKNEAVDVENLDFLGFVPHEEIEKIFSEVSLFVNTSSSEGFPNTFLEAWSCGIPICSLNCDPDKVISTNKLGCNVVNFNDLIIQTDNILNNEDMRREFSKNCINYVKENHSFKDIIDQYENLFNKLIEDSKKAG